MPTVFRFMGFRFSFFSNDHEPIHIHVTKGDGAAKFDVLPHIELVTNIGFKKSELKMAESIIEENKELIIDRWMAFFSEE